MSLVKKLLFFISIIFLLIIIAAIIAAFNAQKIASALQPQIESLASTSLGTKVRLGELKVSLFPRIEIVAPKVHIGEANEVQGVSLQEGSLTLDWFPLLYGKAIAQIALVKPRITIEQGPEGIVIPGLPLGRTPGPNTSEHKTEESTPSSGPDMSQRKSSPIALDIRSITVRDGNINLLDLIPTTNNAPVEISSLEVVTSLKLNGKKAVLDGIRTNFSARGIGEFQITGSTVEFDLASSEAAWQDLWIQGPGIKLTANGTASPKAYEIKIAKSSVNLAELALLGKALSPLAAARNYNPTGAVIVDVTIAGSSLTAPFSPPLVAGSIELQDIGATIPDRELKNISGSLVLGHEEKLQHVSTEKISLNLIDAEQLSKPLPITIALETVDITPDFEVKIPDWSIESPGTILSGDATAKLGQTGKKFTDISLNSKSSIDIKGLKEYLKALTPLEVGGSIAPAGTAHIDISTAAIKGTGTAGLKSIHLVQPPYTISDISADYRLEFNSNGANAKSDNLNLKVNDIPLKISAILKAANRYTAFSIDNIVAKGFEGEIKGNVHYTLPATFGVNLQSQSLSLPPLIKLSKLEWLPDTNGSIGPLNLGIQGQLGAALLNSLNGRVSLKARDTVIKGFNLTGAVLGKINEISLISGGLSKGAPEILNDYTSRKDTIVKEVILNGLINQGTLNLGAMRLISDVFEIEGKGKVELPTSALDMATAFSFNKDFTQRIGTSIKEIEKITAADGRLSFPLKLSGIPPKILVVPDFGELLKIGAKKALKDQAGKLIDKALGGRGEGKGPKGDGNEVLDKLLAW
jgi:uncharacterized protein involved in outer membrane biogenesis